MKKIKSKHQDQNPRSMINLKTNQDFNNEKPDTINQQLKESFTILSLEDSNIDKQKKATKRLAEIKIFTCPMHPTVKTNKAGKCPVCGMQLAYSHP